MRLKPLSFPSLQVTLIVALVLIFAQASHAHAQNLLTESTFDDGSTGAWWVSGSDVAIVDGQLCATTTDNGSEERWEAMIGHSDLNLSAGRLHDLAFDLRAPAGVTVTVLVQQAAEPWTEYYGIDIPGSSATERHGAPYRQVTGDPAAQLVFQFGGQGAATVCIDNVLFELPTAPPIPDAAIHANQLGYFTGGAKQATVVTDAPTAQTWTLLARDGKTALEGVTTPFGSDTSSGLNVQLIDFSSYDSAGAGYTLQVGALRSHPFDIGDNPYGDLLYDSARYYYYNRSSAPLTMPYVDDARWVRAAGPADDAVACWPGSGCSYTLDVSKGWYDAGDYGKYVVNSGFSVWQLMNIYERGLHRAPNVLPQFADDSMNIPESGNGVPDLLDEIRYNLEFVLGMQVPVGEPLVGMVHHKMHNTEWHELGTPPAEMGSDDRYLTPPTTIATLMFAGATAQCARIWAPIDPEFSDRCLIAAETAWSAANANPAVTHPDEPYSFGGGPYGNLETGAAINDEFYWAAAELFISTDKAEYRDYLLTSPNHLTPAQVPISSYQIDLIARMSLSLVPNDLAEDELDAVKATIVELADIYVETINATGFGAPIADEYFYWGSNSELLNDLMVLGSAYDITDDAVYLRAAQQGVNYIFGRNALGQSYVSGHGEQATRNPTSTWYANSANPAYPPAPSGFLVGGANVTHPDEFATDALGNCIGMTCYMDYIRAYSTNETGINVNASLVWVASFLLAEAAPPPQDALIFFLPLISR